MKRNDNYRKALEGRKDVKVFGKVDCIDWDGNTSQPTYLLKDVQVFDKDNNKIVNLSHMWFYCDEPLNRVLQKTVISFTGDAYHYNKKGEKDSFSVKPKTNIRILKTLKERVKMGKWYLMKGYW